MKTLWDMFEGINVGISPIVVRLQKPKFSTFAKVSPKTNNRLKTTDFNKGVRL